MTTIKQVAELAGVSPTTASYALNNRPEVKQETKDRVLKAAYELNYIPNKLAQSFRNKRSMIINVITNEDIEKENTFSSELFGILAGVRERNYSVLITLASSEDCQDARWIANTLGNRFCDGYLVFGNSLELLIDNIIKNHQKGILLSSRTDLDFPQVNTDGFKAICDIVHLAFSSQKKKLAYFSYGFHTKEECLRRDAFVQTVSELGIQNCGVFECGNGCETLEHSIDLCISSGVDLIVCWNDSLALSVIAHLNGKNLLVPNDIAVTGVDDIAVSEQYGITTARQPLFEKGYTAATMLIQMIENNTEHSVNVDLPCSVIKRMSL